MTAIQTRQFFLLHGVTAASDRSLVTGELHSRGLTHVEAVPEGDLAAIVSVHEEAASSQPGTDGIMTNPERTAELAILHHEVLSGAADVADVLPVRFGSVFSSRDGAPSLINRERHRFLPELARLKGTVEMGVRIAVQDRGAQPVEIDSGRGYLKSLASGRTAAARDRARQAAGGRALLEALAENALEAVQRTGRLRTGEAAILADVAFLVKREAAAKFLADAQRMLPEIEALGLNAGVSGPWPAYSFTSSDQEAAASWATH